MIRENKGRRREEKKEYEEEEKGDKMGSLTLEEKRDRWIDR